MSKTRTADCFRGDESGGGQSLASLNERERIWKLTGTQGNDRQGHMGSMEVMIAHGVKSLLSVFSRSRSLALVLARFLRSAFNGYHANVIVEVLSRRETANLINDRREKLFHRQRC